MSDEQWELLKQTDNKALIVDEIVDIIVKNELLSNLDSFETYHTIAQLLVRYGFLKERMFKDGIQRYVRTEVACP